jgi:uncharacterized membrane protein YsdA (DUF1294 family)
MKNSRNVRPPVRNTSRPRYRSPYDIYFWLAAGIILALTLGLYLLKLPLYVAFIIAANVVTFGLYTFDKRRAQHDGRRVPELILHGLAVAGGALGGIAGQWLLRHKTRKPDFHIVLWASLVVHVLIFVVFQRFLLTYNPEWLAILRR